MFSQFKVHVLYKLDILQGDKNASVPDGIKLLLIPFHILLSLQWTHREVISSYVCALLCSIDPPVLLHLHHLHLDYTLQSISSPWPLSLLSSHCTVFRSTFSELVIQISPPSCRSRLFLPSPLSSTDERRPAVLFLCLHACCLFCPCLLVELIKVEDGWLKQSKPPLSFFFALLSFPCHLLFVMVKALRGGFSHPYHTWTVDAKSWTSWDI